MIDFDTTYSILENPFSKWDPHACHLSFMDNTLVPSVHWSQENFLVGMERLVELWPHFLEEYLGMHSLSLIHHYIGEFHIFIEGPSKLQVCIGKDDFPKWWYDVFIFPNISK